MLLPAENANNYLVHINYKMQLIVRAERIDIFSDSFLEGEFSCVIRSGSQKLFATPAVLDSNQNIQCVRDEVS